MKALTVWQPHASLIAIGEKVIETRSWKTQYRGPLAIHAAKMFPETMRRLAYHTEPFRTVLGRAHLIPTQSYGMTPEDLPCGAVLCVVRLIDIRPVEALLDMRPHLSEQERAFGDYSPGRFGWLMEVLHRFAEPITWSGHQGLWECPAEALKHWERSAS